MTKDPSDPAALANIACQVANEAAALVRSQTGSARSTGTKSTPNDLVTDTDIACENLIRERLTAATPGATMLGEEQGGAVGDDGVGWIIDPVDGTVNFLYDLPAVAVSIAATVGGDVVAAAVVDVVRDETFTAHLGGGARRDGERVHVGGASSLAEALVITGYSYDTALRAEQSQIVAAVVERVRDVRCFGSAALHLVWVACGRADAYYETDVRRWDYAAGALIAQEAGARVGLPPQAGGLLTATAPALHDDLTALVAGTGVPQGRHY